MIVTHVHRFDITNVMATVLACYLSVNFLKGVAVVWLRGVQK